MSEQSLSVPALTREEMIRFAQLHGQFIDRTRLLASRVRSAQFLAGEAGLPYSWVLSFLKGEDAHYDLDRVCSLYLTCIGPDLER